MRAASVQSGQLAGASEEPASEAASDPNPSSVGASRVRLMWTLASLADAMRLNHIAYVQYDHSKRGVDVTRSVSTLPADWLARNWSRPDSLVQAIVARGRLAILPFDTNEMTLSPRMAGQFEAAARDDVGRSAMAIPVRGRDGGRGLVVFTSIFGRDAWRLHRQIHASAFLAAAGLVQAAAKALDSGGGEIAPEAPEARISRERTVDRRGVDVPALSIESSAFCPGAERPTAGDRDENPTAAMAPTRTAMPKGRDGVPPADRDGDRASGAPGTPERSGGRGRSRR